jgi:hypothetical protein
MTALSGRCLCGEVHLYGASLNDPERVRPKLHCRHEKRLSWLHIGDDLPRYPGIAAATGGHP